MVLILKEHQIKFADLFFETNEKGLVAVQPTGSGKTITALEVARRYLEKDDSNFVYFVAPKSIVPNYMNDIYKFNIDIDVKRISVLGVDAFYKDYEDGFIGMTNALLVLDEAHAMRTKVTCKDGKISGGKKAYSFVKAANEADRVLLLTATPIVNGIYDIANLLSMLTRNNNEHVYSSEEFGQLLSDKVERKKVIGGKFVFHHMSPEDMLEYPSVEYQNVYLKMPETLYEQYKLEEEKLTEKGVAFFTTLRMAANKTAGAHDGEEVKAKWLKSFIESHIEGMDKRKESRLSHRFVIYSPYINNGMKLHMTELNEIDVPYSSIVGKMTIPQRAESINKYNSDKTQTMILNASGKEGLDLAKTDYIILNESGWNEASEQQIVGRGVRRNSHKGYVRNKVTVLRLLMVKPDEYEYGVDRILAIPGNRNHKGDYKSADLLLMSVSDSKKAGTNEALLMIEKYNIDASNVYSFINHQCKNAIKTLNSTLFHSSHRKMKSFQYSAKNVNPTIFVPVNNNIMLHLPVFSAKSDVAIRMKLDGYYASNTNGMCTLYKRVMLKEQDEYTLSHFVDAISDTYFTNMSSGERSILSQTLRKIAVNLNYIDDVIPVMSKIMTTEGALVDVMKMKLPLIMGDWTWERSGDMVIFTTSPPPDITKIKENKINLSLDEIIVPITLSCDNTIAQLFEVARLYNENGKAPIHFVLDGKIVNRDDSVCDIPYNSLLNSFTIESPNTKKKN